MALNLTLTSENVKLVSGIDIICNILLICTCNVVSMLLTKHKMTCKGVTTSSVKQSCRRVRPDVTGLRNI